MRRIFVIRSNGHYIETRIKNFEEIYYYCNACNKLYYSCYEMGNILICSKCFSEIKSIPKNKIQSFIRKKRLLKLKEINNENRG